MQRQLGPLTAVEIGYLGSQSKRLERMFDANEAVPGPGSVQTRRPYPEFTKVQEIGNVAEAKYNSMAVKVTRRLNQGLSLLFGYTLSKSTDNGSGIRVLTGDEVLKSGRWSHTRDPFLLESSLPGVFACGDVRLSPVKRVAAAVGEGSMAIAFVHQYLARERLG